MINSTQNNAFGALSSTNGSQSQAKSPQDIQKKIKELEGALKLEQSPEKKKTIEKQLENLHKMAKGGAGQSSGSAASGGETAQTGGGDSVDLGDSDREATESGQLGAASQGGAVGQPGGVASMPSDSTVNATGSTPGIGGDSQRPPLHDFISSLASNYQAA